MAQKNQQKEAPKAPAVSPPPAPEAGPPLAADAAPPVEPTAETAPPAAPEVADPPPDASEPVPPVERLPIERDEDEPPSDREPMPLAHLIEAVAAIAESAALDSGEVVPPAGVLAIIGEKAPVPIGPVAHDLAWGLNTGLAGASVAKRVAALTPAELAALLFDAIGAEVTDATVGTWLRARLPEATKP